MKLLGCRSTVLGLKGILEQVVVHLCEVSIRWLGLTNSSGRSIRAFTNLLPVLAHILI
jgi:hypothetical protein